jgi:hypothetical protein
VPGDKDRVWPKADAQLRVISGNTYFWNWSEGFNIIGGAN